MVDFHFKLLPLLKFQSVLAEASNFRLKLGFPPSPRTLRSGLVFLTDVAEKRLNTDFVISVHKTAELFKYVFIHPV